MGREENIYRNKVEVKGSMEVRRGERSDYIGEYRKKREGGLEERRWAFIARTTGCHSQLPVTPAPDGLRQRLPLSHLPRT